MLIALSCVAVLVTSVITVFGGNVCRASDVLEKFYPNIIYYNVSIGCQKTQTPVYTRSIVAVDKIRWRSSKDR